MTLRISPRALVLIAIAGLLQIGGTAAGSEPLRSLLEKPRSEAAEGMRIERDPATRTVTVWLDDAGDGERSLAPRGIYGKVVVRNRSFDTAEIYWSLNDFVTPWTYVDTIPPGWKVKFLLFKFGDYVVAAENVLFLDGDWEWGPAAFFLRRKFKWTLLP